MYQTLISHFRDSAAANGIYLDPFQEEAIGALAENQDVLVSAPTGSGKTIIAEFAVELAFSRGLRCIYTAPIKALSNQKYRELSSQYGAENIGLLTGDTSINRDAQILVVTTEVLRNMLFAQDRALPDIGYVILDEVHYLADKGRGPVWEELILQLPLSARLISLSATIENLAEFTAWLRSIRGKTHCVVSEKRPVPLAQIMLSRGKFIPLFAEQKVENTANSTRPRFNIGRITQAITAEQHHGLQNLAQQGQRRRQQRIAPAVRKKIGLKLQKANLLPAIEFIFSRKGCDKAVSDLLEQNITFTTHAQRKIIQKKLTELREKLSREERKAIKFGLWEKALLSGFAAHHAGMFPAIKELVEELTSCGLLSLIYATGTLSLGINMPVRTVVLEELYKWNGENFENLTGTEYTQLIGRAGRRGKDTTGNAVILARPHTDLAHLEVLSAGKLERLNSAFFPSYNTVLNLIANYGYEDARLIMGRSFAQYQLNAQLGTIHGKIARIRKKIATAETQLADICDQGDFLAYLALRGETKRASKAARRKAKAEYRREIHASWRNLGNGRLYAFAINGKLEYAVVLSHNQQRARIINFAGELAWLTLSDLSAPLRDLGDFALPHGISPKQKSAREFIAQDILTRVGERIELGQDNDLTAAWDRFAVPETPELLAHPVHQCPDLAAHFQKSKAYQGLLRQLQLLRSEADAAHDSVAAKFDAATQILFQLGILQNHAQANENAIKAHVANSHTELTELTQSVNLTAVNLAAEKNFRLGMGAYFLRGIHNENDLLLTICLQESAVRELDAASFAGFCAGFLGDKRLTRLPITQFVLRKAWKQVEANYWFLADIEAKSDLALTQEPNVTAVELFTCWAQGMPLGKVLQLGSVEVGDFISSARRLLDLLGQLARIGEDSWVGQQAQAAIQLVRRWEWL